MMCQSWGGIRRECGTIVVSVFSIVRVTIIIVHKIIMMIMAAIRMLLLWLLLLMMMMILSIKTVTIITIVFIIIAMLMCGGRVTSLFLGSNTAATDAAAAYSGSSTLLFPSNVQWNVASIRIVFITCCVGLIIVVIMMIAPSYSIPRLSSLLLLLSIEFLLQLFGCLAQE